MAPDRVPARILIACDDALVRLGIATALACRDRITVVGMVGAADGAVSTARDLRPDVVLLESPTPGPAVLAVISDLAEEAGVVMLTSTDDPHSVTRAIESGADGYLVHGRFDLGQFADAVLDAAQGVPYVSPGATTALVKALRRRGTPTGARPPSARLLTDRERQIITLIVEGLTNDEAARVLGLTAKTVKNHVQSIYAKLGVHSRSAALTLWLGIENASSLGISGSDDRDNGLC